MKRRTHIQLTPYEDLFSTEEQRQDYHREKVMDIPLSELHPFKDHPFKVLDDDRMADTTRSVQERGVLVPAIARPRPDGGYELISGHRRKRACELAGLDTMPVIVREMDDNAAVLVMVDSNIQRENILPSERAFAYKMKLEALKRQGARTDLTSGQVVQKSRLSAEIVAEGTGESYKQLLDNGTISGGMIPKMENAFNAICNGVAKVIITKADAIDGKQGTHIIA